MNERGWKGEHADGRWRKQEDAAVRRIASRRRRRRTVVVEQLGRVEDALGRLRDVARVFARQQAGLAVLRVEDAQRVLVVLGGARRLF